MGKGGKKDLPLDSGARIVKVFEAWAWTVRRGKKGHFVLNSVAKPNLHISIPDHRIVDRNLLRTELRKAGKTVEEYVQKYNEVF